MQSERRCNQAVNREKIRYKCGAYRHTMLFIVTVYAPSDIDDARYVFMELFKFSNKLFCLERRSLEKSATENVPYPRF